MKQFVVILLFLLCFEPCRAWNLNGRFLKRSVLFFHPSRTLSSSSSSALFGSRRDWLSSVASITTGGLLFIDNGRGGSALAFEGRGEELPSFLKDYTKLAPLGQPRNNNDNKSTNLSLKQIAQRLTNDLTNGATGQGGYFISGDLSPDIFRDDCVFVDPTNRVSSLSQYQNALRILFDPKESFVQLVQPLEINESQKTISGVLRSRGTLQLPWHPYIKAYETEITYQIDDQGLIAKQEQSWSISANEALQQSFTPSVGNRPPKSNIPQPDNEPKIVTELFNAVNGRRVNEYTQNERFEIGSLIQAIADATILELQAPNMNATDRLFTSQKEIDDSELLSGTWILAYLQPGPQGQGIDRRIPFPEFDFNNNYQIFNSANKSIINVGQLLGPLAEVQVSGSFGLYNNNDSETTTKTTIPPKYVANIEKGSICWKQSSCIDFPISGEGIFESVYVGKRLRIGQNINGGGARIVQIRLAK